MSKPTEHPLTSFPKDQIKVFNNLGEAYIEAGELAGA